MQKSGIAATRERKYLRLFRPRGVGDGRNRTCVYPLPKCVHCARETFRRRPLLSPLSVLLISKERKQCRPTPSPQTDTDVRSKSQLLPCSIILPSPLRRGKKGSQLTEHCVQKSHEIYTSRSRGGGWACGQNAVSSVLFVLPSPEKRSFERLYPPPLLTPPPLPPLFQATAEAAAWREVHGSSSC